MAYIEHKLTHQDALEAHIWTDMHGKAKVMLSLTSEMHDDGRYKLMESSVIPMSIPHGVDSIESFIIALQGLCTDPPSTTTATWEETDHNGSLELSVAPDDDQGDTTYIIVFNTGTNGIICTVSGIDEDGLLDFIEFVRSIKVEYLAQTRYTPTNTGQ